MSHDSSRLRDDASSLTLRQVSEAYGGTVNLRLALWVDDAVSLLAPERCVWCGSAHAVDGACEGCKVELPWNRVACPSCAQPMPVVATCAKCLKRPPAFDAAWTSFVHVEPIRRGVHRLKYGAQFEQSRVLGALMGRELAARTGPLPDLLIPVPLPRRRMFLRGYNQAQELARAVSRVVGVPIDATAARLVRAPGDQIGQTAAQRRRNLRGAFRIERDLTGKRVALIDDVMTTGATLDALARAARKTGAAHIEAWALARAP